MEEENFVVKLEEVDNWEGTHELTNEGTESPSTDLPLPVSDLEVPNDEVQVKLEEVDWVGIHHQQMTEGTDDSSISDSEFKNVQVKMEEVNDWEGYQGYFLNNLLTSIWSDDSTNHRNNKIVSLVLFEGTAVCFIVPLYFARLSIQRFCGYGISIDDISSQNYGSSQVQSNLTEKFSEVHLAKLFVKFHKSGCHGIPSALCYVLHGLTCL